jgi:hypothetical protein
MNHWGIPDALEEEIKERDKACVYCRIQMIEQMPPRMMLFLAIATLIAGRVHVNLRTWEVILRVIGRLMASKEREKNDL